MLFGLLVWWYSQGWLDAWRSIPRAVKKVQLAFTLPVLLQTLFSPWKQIVSKSGRSLDEKFRNLIDNLISRTIGFFVRLVVLVAALIFISLTAVANLAIAIVWPAIPLAVLYCLFRGIAG